MLRQPIALNAVLIFQKLDMPDEFPLCGLSQDPEKHLDRSRHRAKIRKSVYVVEMTTFLYTGRGSIQDA